MSYVQCSLKDSNILIPLLHDGLNDGFWILHTIDKNMKVRELLDNTPVHFHVYIVDTASQHLQTKWKDLYQTSVYYTFDWRQIGKSCWLIDLVNVYHSQASTYLIARKAGGNFIASKMLNALGHIVILDKLFSDVSRNADHLEVCNNKSNT